MVYRNILALGICKLRPLGLGFGVWALGQFGGYGFGVHAGLPNKDPNNIVGPQP